jgi:hypothetical protein
MTGRPQSTGRWEWAGLAIGPLAWGLSTQVNYTLAPYTCVQHRLGVAVVALALTLVSFVGSYWSWRSFRAGDVRADLQDTHGGRPHRMLAVLGLLTGILFGATIAVQGAAALILDGCLR